MLINSLKAKLPVPQITSSLRHYILAALSVLAGSGLCYFIKDLTGYQSVSFILLFVVSILAIFFGTGPIALAAFMSAMIWNFFFIPPRFTIHIEKAEDALMLGMFFIIALVNGILTSRVRRQEILAVEREKRTNALYYLTRQLSEAENIDATIEAAVTSTRTYFGPEVYFFRYNDQGSLVIYPLDKTPEISIVADRGLISEALDEGRKAAGLQHLTSSSGFSFYSLKGKTISPGAIAIRHGEVLKEADIEFLDTFLTQISNGIERVLLNDLAIKARFLDESDKLYKTLFNSLSHELRIPVATIMSASESLITTIHSPEIQSEISHEILKATQRLNRLIDNLLNMSRLESGQIRVRKDWYDIHDLFNKVTESLSEELKPFILVVSIEDELPLVKLDYGLIEQVLHNLLHNATQYATGSEKLYLDAKHSGKEVIITVSDEGPGFREMDLPNIFNKFFRIEGSKPGGTGLGLSIARGFVEAHGGSINVRNRKTKGAEFIIIIPSENPDMDLKLKSE